MKKIFSIVIAIIMLLSSTVFADVIIPGDGDYYIFGNEISEKVVWIATTIFVGIIFIVGLLIIDKKIKSKGEKVVAIVFLIILMPFLAFFILDILPNPDYHHSRMVGGYDVVGPYNNQFYDFDGNNKTPSEVRMLLTVIRTHNENMDEVERFGKIEVSGINDLTSIQSSKRYKIDVIDYRNDGAIKTIQITEQ